MEQRCPQLSALAPETCPSSSSTSAPEQIPLGFRAEVSGLAGWKPGAVLTSAGRSHPICRRQSKPPSQRWPVRSSLRVTLLPERREAPEMCSLGFPGLTSGSCPLVSTLSFLRKQVSAERSSAPSPHVICGCFHATGAELSCHDVHGTTTRPRVFPVGPFAGKVCKTLKMSKPTLHFTHSVFPIPFKDFLLPLFSSFFPKRPYPCLPPPLRSPSEEPHGATSLNFGLLL